MLPDPLHPAVVHLPVALAVLVPLLAVLVIGAVRLGFLPARSWAVVGVLQVLLVGSAWVAVETGEEEEDRVEHVVAERHIETHEEAAERFLALAAWGLLAVGIGSLPGRIGAVGRILAVPVVLGVLAAGVSVGHSGGALVYEHGAGSAYAEARGAAAPLPDDDHD